MVGRFLLLIPLLFFSLDQPKLVKVKVSNDVTIYVPKEWRVMDNLDFTARYPSVRAPLAAYTNDERTADFSVNISATQWPDENLEIARGFFKASLTNLFDRVTILQEGIHEVNGRSFIFFEFESRVNGDKNQLGQTDPALRYTYIQYLIDGRRTLVFTFNCYRREQRKWQEVAEKMMEKIRVK